MKLYKMIFMFLYWVLLTMSLSFFFLSYIFMLNDHSLFIEWEICFVKNSILMMSWYFDPMSLIFLGVVNLISSHIFKYSIYYMDSDKHHLRFIFLLFFFVGSMWFLIISGNLMSLLLGWDGLGLTSYLLVVYYQNENSCNSGMLTILSNRVGDATLLSAIGLMSALGSWNFDFFDSTNIYFCSLLLIAGMTKSAQLPFSAWLPAAMAAPTPVSALVHSSTLVTAGVYLLLRMNKLFESTSLSSGLLIVGVLTMFMSGLGANFESDLKKIVALSTLSQLGLMFMILGMNMPCLVFFHLITHALFKSTLFMCVGFMIHSSESTQDSRLMNNYMLKSPLLSILLSLTNLSLMGFPFLAGFYSKDIILEYMFMSYYNLLVIFFILISTGLTFSYSVRLMYMSCGPVSLSKNSFYSEDLNMNLWGSLFILSLMSILSGYIMSVYSFFDGMLVILVNPQKYMIILICMILGLTFLNIIHSKSSKSFMKNKIIFYSYYLMWNINFMSTKIISLPILNGGYKAMKVLDLGWYEHWGAYKSQKYFLKLSNFLQKAQLSIMINFYLIGVLMMSLVFTIFML